MKDIIIYGSGGMAREVAALIEDINAVQPTWNIAGFIDDFRGNTDELVNGYKVLGSGSYLNSAGAARNIVIAVGDPDAKEGIYEKIKGCGLEFPSIIHPSARIARNASVGEGTIVGIDCIVSVNVKLGRNVFLNTRTVLGHDVEVGDFTSCLVNCLISGNVSIGRSCVLGSGCIVKEKISIADKAKVGMGAIVCYDVAEGYTVMSRPSASMAFHNV